MSCPFPPRNPKTHDNERRAGLGSLSFAGKTAAAFVLAYDPTWEGGVFAARATFTKQGDFCGWLGGPSGPFDPTHWQEIVPPTGIVSQADGEKP